MLQLYCHNTVHGDEGRGNILENPLNITVSYTLYWGKWGTKTYTGCNNIRKRTQMSWSLGSYCQQGHTHIASGRSMKKEGWEKQKSCDFFCSYSSGLQVAATNMKAARWLPPTAPRWPSYLWNSSQTAAVCSLIVKGKPELVPRYLTIPIHCFTAAQAPGRWPLE